MGEDSSRREEKNGETYMTEKIVAFARSEVFGGGVCVGV